MKKVLGKIWVEVKSFLLIFAQVSVLAVFLIGGVLLFKECAPEAEAGSGNQLVLYGTNTTFDDGQVYRAGSSGGLWGWQVIRDASVGTAAGDADIRVSISVYVGTGELPGTCVPESKLYVFNLTRGQVCFDLTTLPAGSVIWSATLDLYLDQANSSLPCTYSTIVPRVVITPGVWAGTGIPVVANYSEQTDELLCSSLPFGANDPSDYRTFTFNQAGLDWISNSKGAGAVRFKVRDYVWDALGNNPECVSDADGGIYRVTFKGVEAGGVMRPKLTITYGDAPIEREPVNPDNAAPGGAGHDVTSVEWKTLRAAYSDEELGFKVTGEAGTAIQLRLVRENDTIVDQIDNNLKSDGIYYWKASCSAADVGFVRCKELTHGINSEWGYIASVPDASQIHNYTYAVHTYYPQYERPFSSYIVNETTPMVIHWKTDIQDDEQTDYSFRLYHLGDSGDTLFNQTLAWLCDNYYKNVYVNNDFLAGYRYIIFAGDLGGGEDYDGMIIDLARPYIGANYGFYQGLIYKNAAAEYSITHSAHCYIKGLSGIVMTLNTDNYDAEVPITLSVAVDDETGGLLMWDSYEVLNLRGSDLGVGQGVVLQTITGALEDEFEVPGLVSGSALDDYTLRVRFYDSSPGCTYEYIHDVPYTVGGGKKAKPDKDLVGWLKGLLAGFGLDSAAGRWAVTIAVMAVAFVFFSGSKLLRVVVPLLVLGLALVIGWLDIWVIALLALGAGVSIFFLMRRGHGGGES